MTMVRKLVVEAHTVLPLDAMLERYVLSSYVCPSVRLSVCHKSEFYKKWLNLGSMV